MTFRRFRPLRLPRQLIERRALSLAMHEESFPDAAEGTTSTYITESVPEPTWGTHFGHGFDGFPIGKWYGVDRDETKNKETQMQTGISPLSVIERLDDAINRHDLTALTACFAPDYASDFPAHPDRAFRGHEQMRKNWTQIFGGVPDIAATLLRSAVAGDTAWAEWDWRGTRVDGAPFAMRGVTIVGVADDRITWAHMYMEPVETSGAGSDAAIHRAAGGGVPA